jgi:HD-like signal output (HDOD) protein
LYNKISDKQLRSGIKKLKDSLSPSLIETIEELLTAVLNLDEVPSSASEKFDKEDIKNIINTIIQKVNDKRITLPVIPETSKRIVKVLEDPMTSMDKISKYVQTEQALVEKLMRLANSVFYSAVGKKVTEIKSALVKIGVRDIKKNLYTIAQKETFKVDSEPYRSLMDTLLLHSAASSAAASLLVDLKVLPTPDKFVMPALFHDVGKMWALMIIVELTEKGVIKKVDNIGTIIKILASLHAKLGTSLLKSWNFSEDIYDVVLHHHNIVDPNNKVIKVVLASDQFAKMCGFTEYAKTSIDYSIFESLNIKEREMKKIKRRIYEFIQAFKVI